ncbi:MAG: Glu/Leu/Phe/Val dehydrogenase [Candidatus Nealsonbacteria bacterium]|nr:Glu/Leu/Phe/Val dehydrogenase [Candidatus Nealsonbacteria bacterium]
MKVKNQIIADEFGPQHVLEVNSSSPRFRGLLVIDNLALGVGKGGIRLAAGLTPFELFRLARTMTWKNSLFELPFGGAKAGILVDPKKISPKEKKAIIQAFAKLLAPFVPKYYIAGPDIGTGEQEMKWFSQALGIWKSSTGKPKDFCLCVEGECSCGLPHELGSTGFGVAQATQVAMGLRRQNLVGAKVAVAGFGNVGTFAARHLAELGAKIVAVADVDGTVFDKEGLSVEKLLELKEKRQSLTAYPGAQILPLEKIYELPVDVLIPAAVSDVINRKNYQRVKARIIVEGANIPIPEEIEEKLWQKGILIVPDFVANGGGVISSFAEYRGRSPQAMFRIVGEKIRRATQAVLRRSLKSGRNPREVALVLAKERVRRAMKS